MALARQRRILEIQGYISVKRNPRELAQRHGKRREGQERLLMGKKMKGQKSKPIQKYSLVFLSLIVLDKVTKKAKTRNKSTLVILTSKV